jgi:hypothetical protein
MVKNADAISCNDNLKRARAERESHDLKRAINAAIDRQARRWRIRFDQAQALLLDRKAIA